MLFLYDSVVELYHSHAACLGCLDSRDMETQGVSLGDYRMYLVVWVGECGIVRHWRLSAGTVTSLHTETAMASKTGKGIG